MKLKLYQSQTRDFQSVAVAVAAAAAAAVAVPVAIAKCEFKKQLQQQQCLQHPQVVLLKVAAGAGATLSDNGQNIALRAKPCSQLALPMRA